MIRISDAAQAHFAKLLANQGRRDTNPRICD